MVLAGRHAGIWLVTCVFSILLLSSWMGFAASPKRVLILDSFGRDVAPFGIALSSFRTTLATELGEPVDIHEAALDMARFSDPGTERPFADFLERRFAGRPLDLVVPLGAPAARFAARYREELFASTPVLFAAVDERMLPANAVGTNATLVTQRVRLPGILDNVLQVQPEVTNIAVVLGSTPLEEFWAGECRREWGGYTNRVSFTWLNSLPLPQMVDAARRLPPRSAVLFLMLLMDAGNVPYDGTEPLKALHVAANAPVFGYFESQLGLGTVGGRMYPDRLVGERAARAAVRILRGEPAGNIPREEVPLSTPRYDWRELTRWGIDLDRLPPGSIVEFREPAFWRRYWRHLVAVTGLCGLQTGLIISLVVNRAKRRESEARLKLAADAAGAGLWSLDIGSGCFWFTRKTRELFDLVPDETVTLERILQLVHPDDRERVRAQVREVIRSRGDIQVDYRVVRKDGSVRWFHSRGSVHCGRSGRPGHLMGVSVDHTARKRAEQALRDFSARFIKTQERERARLARELHDDITQRLARLAIDVGRAEAGQTPQLAGEAVRSVRRELIRLSEDIHALSYRLHPSILEDLGLAAALRAEAERLENQISIPIVVRVEELPESISPDAALCLFRVAQEALRNTMCHAHAGRITISLRRAEGGLQLVVQDDGRGFDPAVQRDRPSLGLASMRERVQLLRGEFDLESAPGCGTTVLAWVPLQGRGL
jgi:PAS domain S-box-containing protein